MENRRVRLIREGNVLRDEYLLLPEWIEDGYENWNGDAGRFRGQVDTSCQSLGQTEHWGEESDGDLVWVGEKTPSDPPYVLVKISKFVVNK